MNVFKCPNCNKWFEEQDVNIATMSQGYIKEIPKQERCTCVDCGVDVEDVEMKDALDVLNKGI
jgi:hypothetical protein